MLARIQLALGFVFAVSFVIAVFVARSPYPYRDDWDWLAWRLGGPVSLDRLLSLHNEHVPLLPRLIFLAQFWIEKSRGDVMAGAALVEMLIVGALVFNETRRHAWPSRTERAIAIGAAMSILCFNWQLQSLLFATTITFPLVEMLALIAIVCAINATSAASSRRAWTAGALAAAAAAMATTSAGLLVPAVAGVLAWCRRARPSIVITFALAFAAGLAGYLLLRQSPATSMPSASIGQIIALFFAFFASFASYGSPVFGVGAGVIVFGAGLAVLWPVLRRSPDVSRLDHFAAGVVLFTMAAALAVASARAGFGATQGAQSRYATFILPYWCAVWLVAWDRACRSSAFRVRRSIAAVAVLVGLALLPLHLLTAIVWREKSDNVSAAALALRVGVEDDRWLRTLHPRSSVVTDTVARLRAIGDAAFQMPPLEIGPDEVRALAACSASFLALPLTRPGDYELRSSLDVAGDAGFVLDGQGTLIGLARPAPLVAATEPSHAEVIGAVLREFRHRSPPQWLGFARSPAEAPAVVVIERKSAPVCRASIASR